MKRTLYLFLGWTLSTVLAVGSSLVLAYLGMYLVANYLPNLLGYILFITLWLTPSLLVATHVSRYFFRKACSNETAEDMVRWVKFLTLFVIIGISALVLSGLLEQVY